MAELTELETHRRLITSQIHREITQSNKELRDEIRMRFNALESRLSEQEKAIYSITHRLMDLSLYENKVINEAQRLKRRNQMLSAEIGDLVKLINSLKG